MRKNTKQRTKIPNKMTKVGHKMSGLGNSIDVSEEDFERTVGGEIPQGTPIGRGYRVACTIPVFPDRTTKKEEKGAVYLARGGHTGMRRILLTRGALDGLSASEGPVSEKDENYDKYCKILDSFDRGTSRQDGV